jgi:hypothetical protein
LGPGLGAVPRVFATAAAVVGLGLGTPECVAGLVEARATGAGDALGAALARTAAGAIVGAALGTTAAALARIVGAAVGTGGLGERRAVATADGAGEGAAVGGVLSATASGAAVGTLIGAAGNSVLGATSYTFCVGWGLGCGRCCGIARGFGGAVGASRASSCRFCGRRCVCGCASAAWRTGAIRGTWVTGGAACVAEGARTGTAGVLRSTVTTVPPSTFSVAPSCDELAMTLTSKIANSACKMSDATVLPASRSR